MIENKGVATMEGKRLRLRGERMRAGTYSRQGPGRVLIDACSATFSTLPLDPTKNHVNPSFDTNLAPIYYVNLSFDVNSPYRSAYA